MVYVLPLQVPKSKGEDFGVDVKILIKHTRKIIYCKKNTIESSATHNVLELEKFTLSLVISYSYYMEMIFVPQRLVILIKNGRDLKLKGPDRDAK